MNELAHRCVPEMLPLSGLEKRGNRPRITRITRTGRQDPLFLLPVVYPGIVPYFSGGAAGETFHAGRPRMAQKVVDR